MTNVIKISLPANPSRPNIEIIPTGKPSILKQRGQPDEQFSGLLAPSIVAWAKSYFAEDNMATDVNVLSLLYEASDAAKNDLDEASANTWAAGYTFPPRYLASDTECLRAAQLNFVTMVRRRQTILAPNRLNAVRVSRLRVDNPEKEKMADLAIGLRVHLPAGFTPNGLITPSPLRATYLSVSSAVNKMLAEVVEQRLAFLLPLGTARTYIPNLHLCKAHWTRKKGKPSGRPLGDLTYVDGTPINTPETSEAAALYYGAILHPTIEDISLMVINFWMQHILKDPSAQWCNLRIWKMDFKGAYTNVQFCPV